MAERILVKILDDEQTSTPTIIKHLGKCLTLPAAMRHLTDVSTVICSSD